jgi:histidine ammonia-lyase
LQVIENVERILGVELFCAAQALDFHQPLKSGKVLNSLHEAVRKQIPHLEKDCIMNELMETAIEIIKDKSLVRLAHKTASEHNLPFGTQWSDEFDRY